jgi:triacylglycerol lipase
MNDNISHIKQMGLDVRKVAIDTDVGVAANAVVIRDVVLGVAKEGKRCVVIGHSKGGVDATEAIAVYQLYEHIRAFIAVQVFFVPSSR